MSGGNKGRHTATSTRGRDEAREASDAEAAEPSKIWANVRQYYPESVQKFVDVVVHEGGLSLSDIEALEVAEHERLMGIIARWLAADMLPPDQKPERNARQKATAHVSAIVGLFSIRLQSRKHLRTLRLAMTPITTPLDSHPKLPAGVRRRMGEVVDGDPSDLGDDLLAN